MRSRPGKLRLKCSPEQLLAEGLLLSERVAQGPLDLPALFGNARPVEVEVGPGKGGFLLGRASRRPEINHLGVEWLLGYACYAADRARRSGLKNVRLMHADAAAVFASAIQPRSLQRVHIYFPDPWPKRRHQRRRLVAVPFVRNVHQALRLGGWLGIVTDHEGYFRQIRLALATAEGLAPVPFRPDSAEWLVGSNYEKKYAPTGRGFHAAAAIRCR